MPESFISLKDFILHLPCICAEKIGEVSLLSVSKTRKIVSCFFFFPALFTAFFLILPPLFGESGPLQPIAFFGSVLTGFLDFFAYLLPFYFLAEGLLILFRLNNSAGGKLLILSLCPMSLLSVLVQLAAGRAPVLAARLASETDHSRLILLIVAVFAAFVIEAVLFIDYAFLLLKSPPTENSRRKSRRPAAGSDPLTAGIEYGRKPKPVFERLRSFREAWKGFLSPETEEPEEEAVFDADENRNSDRPEHRPVYGRLKALFGRREEKPELRSMSPISYPNPEDRPRFYPSPMPAPEYTRTAADNDARRRGPGAAADSPYEAAASEESAFEPWEPESEEETFISVPGTAPAFTDDDGIDSDFDSDDIFYDDTAFDTTGIGAPEPENESPIPAGEDRSPLTAAAGTAGSATPVRRKRPAGYKPPSKDLLMQHQETQYWIIDEDTKEAAEILRRTLEEFGIQAQVTGITRGPVVTMFELLPAPGVKLSKIANLADNIALRLAAGRVRIVAPIPGKHAVGIEVPNRKRALVSFKELIEDPAFKKSTAAIPVILGKDITGETQVIDLTSTPHLLIAGSTGSGKSVCVNSIITSVLYKKSPEEVRMILIDPKIVELKMYNDIPHLLTPVITDAKRAYMALQYGLTEMERRYNLLDALGARNIESYNKKAKESGMTAPHLPYILIVIDEFADLMAANRKDLEQAIARLAAMSRAVGIHLILATQRPSVDVITGLIKANIPSRIAFMTASKIDSRTILDTVGAEKLLGKGDMLYVSSTNPYPTRIQGTFLSEHEVETVTDYVKSLGEPDYLDDEIFMDETEILEDNGDDDPLFDEALQIVVQTGKASASYLQRRLQVGYNRAARMIETMEARGYIGPQNGSKPREVLVTPDRI